jgi:uncharacterized glyoxalase superfamily protein PhnB
MSTCCGDAPDLAQTYQRQTLASSKSARTSIAFLKVAFGAKGNAVFEHEGRVMHAGVRIGDAVLEMGEPADRTGIPSGGFFVVVDDVEAAYARALAAGATVVRPPADIPYGHRSAIVKDPADSCGGPPG